MPSILFLNLCRSGSIAKEQSCPKAGQLWHIPCLTGIGRLKHPPTFTRQEAPLYSNPIRTKKASLDPKACSVKNKKGWSTRSTDLQITNVNYISDQKFIVYECVTSLDKRLDDCQCGSSRVLSNVKSIEQFQALPKIKTIMLITMLDFFPVVV